MTSGQIDDGVTGRESSAEEVRPGDPARSGAPRYDCDTIAARGERRRKRAADEAAAAPDDDVTRVFRGLRSDVAAPSTLTIVL
jgi:hypothetical protein